MNTQINLGLIDKQASMNCYFRKALPIKTGVPGESLFLTNSNVKIN